MSLFRRDNFLLVHEGYINGNRFLDKGRGDGRTVVYETFVGGGDGQKIELLKAAAADWQHFWEAVESPASAGEALGGIDEEKFSFRARHRGRRLQSEQAGADLLTAFAALTGQQLASARTALRPSKVEPVEDETELSETTDEPEQNDPQTD